MNEAELLFTDILNCNRTQLFLNKDLPMPEAKSAFVATVLKRRISGEPIQYILGKTEFMGLEFKVNKDVFIPRPETEILVERVIKIVGELASWRVSELKILDLGTGSGCIAISLAKLLPAIDVTATDVSLTALEIARENARLNNTKVNFILSNLFSTYDLRPTTYDLIISNPPYVATADIDNLQPEISHEPRIALDGGKDGLDFYRKIIRQAPAYLKEGGFLILETGFNQKEAAKNIFQNSGKFEIIEIVKDYNNIDRVIVAKRQTKKWINSLLRAV